MPFAYLYLLYLYFTCVFKDPRTEEKMQSSSSSGKGSLASKARVFWPNSPFADKPTIGELVDRRLDPSKIGEKSKTITRLSCLDFLCFLSENMCYVALLVCLLSLPRCFVV